MDVWLRRRRRRPRPIALYDENALFPTVFDVAFCSASAADREEVARLNRVCVC